MGLVGACEDDELSANANGITISTAKTARAPSTFLLPLGTRGTSVGKNVFVTAGGNGMSSTLVAGRSGGATCIPAVVTAGRLCSAARISSALPNRCRGSWAIARSITAIRPGSTSGRSRASGGRRPCKMALASAAIFS